MRVERPPDWYRYVLTLEMKGPKNGCYTVVMNQPDPLLLLRYPPAAFIDR
jgi:hypothetical protein